MIKSTELRQRFLTHIEKNWEWVNHNDSNFKKKFPKYAGVYILVGSDILNDIHDIMYVGSCINLFVRFSSHRTIKRVYKMGQYRSPSAMCCVVYFKKFKKGFFDFELNAIRKMKPILNKKVYKN